MSERHVEIYGLLEPGSRKVRYIGQSINVERRSRQHWYRRFDAEREQSNPRLAAWLRSLSKPPDFFVFEKVPYSQRHQAEKYYTDALRKMGFDLLNILSGQSAYGELNVNFGGKALSPEVRERIGTSLRGRKDSEEVRARKHRTAEGRLLYVNTAGTSSYPGVSWDKTNKKWLAQILANGKRVNLGRFAVEEDAAAAYQVALAEVYSEGFC